MNWMKIVTYFLLAFVLLSIGFAIGMEVTRRRLGNRTQVHRDGVVVFYAHRTVRCKSCNLVDSMGREVVKTDFAEAVKAGKLQWQDVDYETDEKFAKAVKAGKLQWQDVDYDEKFAKAHDIAGNMILVARFKDGQIVNSSRLDNVMQLARKREEFLQYVRDGIAEVLEDEG